MCYTVLHAWYKMTRCPHDGSWRQKVEILRLIITFATNSVTYLLVYQFITDSLILLLKCSIHFILRLPIWKAILYSFLKDENPSLSLH